MRILFATTCPTPIAFLIGTAGHAQTDTGAIKITDTNGATGILAAAGTTGAINNSSTIVIDETYAPADTVEDGDLDGGFASGTGRTGIRTAGAFSGSIINTGGITVEGNDSAGIALGGSLTGTLSTGGTVAVTGDRSVGVRTLGVSGEVPLAGTITALGSSAVAASIGGDIGGGLVVQGGLSATGYRRTTLPADASKLDADDLLQGGAALSVAGNVAGGIDENWLRVEVEGGRRQLVGGEQQQGRAAVSARVGVTFAL